MIKSTLLFLTAILVSSPMIGQQATTQSPASFTQGFYDWYIPIALKSHKEPSASLALKQKSTLFSPALFNALDADFKAQKKAIGEIVGIDYDPFLFSQDPSSHYTVGDTVLKNGSSWVYLHSLIKGKKSSKPAVIAEVSQVDDHYVFTNFYSPSGTSLLKDLEQLAKSRK